MRLLMKSSTTFAKSSHKGTMINPLIINNLNDFNYEKDLYSQRLL